MNRPVNEWKDKYLQSLAELEEKEKQWGDIEFSLRKCISRLSLIGDGRDSALDKKLETLRNRVRGEQNINQLMQMIEGITTLSDSIASDANGSANGGQMVDQIVPLLQTPPFPDALRGPVKKLARKLKKEELTTELLSEFSGLVKQALAEQGEPVASNGGGLLSRLFTNKQVPEAAAPESDNGAGNTVEQEVVPQAPVVQPKESSSADLHQLPRELLTLLVRELNKVEGWPKPLMPFLGRIDSAPTAAVLISLTEELATTLRPIDPDGVSADRVLIELLEMLDLAGEPLIEINKLKERIEKGVTEKTLPGLLDQIASLVGNARRRAETERQEVESFLLQLTESLQALDLELAGVDQQGRNIIEKSREFGDSVHGHMSDLHADVAAATDLNDLKVTISQRISVIQEKLRQHRQEEELRVEGLEESIGGLKQQLATVEEESEMLRKSVADARKRAFNDALTGLNNRHAFDTRMEEEFARWSRYGFPMSLIVIDIDNFKSINDTYGHKAGDKVLKVVGENMSRQVRKADFPARYGGEEFVVLLPETEREAAFSVAEKIRMAVEKMGFHSGDTSVNITVSCGLAQFQNGDTQESVFNRADAALYLAKGSGKNRTCTEDQVES
ncbi:MAG: diguanylate cyclase [Chromatiales bacterium]|nr:diguanylate cyclase [Chromatiales bacterium]